MSEKDGGGGGGGGGGSNLFNFPGGTNPEQMVANIKNLEAMWDALVMWQEFQAKMRYVKYQACLAQGFTEAQALELCKIIP